MKQLYTLILLLFIFQNAYSQAEKEGQVLVQLHQGFDRETALSNLLEGFEYLSYIENYRVVAPHFGVILLEFEEAIISKQEIIYKLNQHSNVLTAQPNRKLELRNEVNIPNDSLYHRQWNMDTIKAPQAWNITTGGLTAGGDTIVIANIEDGTDFKHRDLQGNLWYNLEEIPNDGIDNDNNGYIDDYRGWNFQAGNDIHPRSVHGTKASGIIGAKGGNGFGVSGVNWNVKIMVLSKAIPEEADIVEAYNYIYEKRKKYNDTNGAEGAFVVGTSLQWGIPKANPTEYPIWCGIYDKLGAEGILNVAATSNAGDNVDLVGDMPSACGSDYLITVANTTINDELKPSSSYGMQSIDLAAPGSAAYTTNHLNQYDIFSGTSSATPHVSGAVGLIYSMPNDLFYNDLKANTAQAPLMVKKYILQGVDTLLSLKYRTVTEGRLNLYKSLLLIQDDYEGFKEELSNVVLFPNPTADWLYVNYDTDNEPFDVELYNDLGQNVKDWRIIPTEVGTKRLQLNVSLLQSGVYFLVLKNSDTQIVKKFVVMVD